MAKQNLKSGRTSGIAQCLRPLTAHAEDMSWIPSTCMAAQSLATPVYRHPVPFLLASAGSYTYVMYMYSIHNHRLYINKTNNIKRDIRIKRCRVLKGENYYNNDFKNVTVEKLCLQRDS